MDIWNFRINTCYFNVDLILLLHQHFELINFGFELLVVNELHVRYKINRNCKEFKQFSFRVSAPEYKNLERLVEIFDMSV